VICPKYRALTIAREFGSGGAGIAASLAEILGWKLLDSRLIEEIAGLAHVDFGLAADYDERVDSWLHRLSRHVFRHGAFEGVAVMPETAVFDAETMAQLTRVAVEQAYAFGDCVIVGRGSQCILQQYSDVFHVFVYAPLADRMARARRRTATDAEAADLILNKDAERAECVRMNFGRDWRDPHLYDLMLSSKRGEDAVASTILSAMREW
jgi:cytidylate kinase